MLEFLLQACDVGRDCHSTSTTLYHAGMENRPIEVETGTDPQASVIVLHGLGASGDDFVPVCEQLDLDAVGPVRHVLPHAPTRPVTINNGFVMPAWYDILSLGGGPAVEDESGLRASQALVEALIAREVARGVSPSRIVLAGFSQGCAMALLTGLRHGERLAGIVGLSGYLPLADKTAAERAPANQATPIFLAHGRFDPMIALPRALATRDALRSLGYSVQWHEYPMEHSVCLPEIADLQRFLLQALKR
jgi:phospholipase/carboxylesterase